ncbi:efflux RND transporter periplasmic adaptor subunit [Singulisphaera sp. Ch08]|uniref:Efflux RND transporter periplasmic adaptor subunit n=1 Tax=Singulisphaera sp. Ch08 TaxID=3120278 RepID=A0AAU7C8M0_9BACT
MNLDNSLPARPILRMAGGLVVLAAALSVAGCKKPEVQAAPPPPMVGIIKSSRMNVPILATPNGTTRALEEVVVRARVRGFLTERHFEEGSHVKKGQLLLVIDEQSYKIALLMSRAKLDEAEAALKKAESSKGREVAAAQLALDEAQLTLSMIEERRARALHTRSAGSAEDVDKAQADRKKFDAQVEADRANLEQARADYEVGILAAKAQVEAAKASVRDAEINLGYCRMYATIDGRIGEAKVKVGNLVGPDATGGSFSDLATIHQLDPMGIEIRTSSRYLKRATQLINEGLAIRLFHAGFEGDDEHPHEGTCFFIDNAIDETTSTFLVKARIPNPEGTLLPGEYAKLEMVVDRIQDAVVVPESAVMETEAGPVVYVVDDESKVAIQRVKAAQSYQGMRILTQGLDAGVPVILQGLQLVRPGMPVKAELAVIPRPVEEDSAAAKSPEQADGKADQSAPHAKPEAKPTH